MIIGIMIVSFIVGIILVCCNDEFNPNIPLIIVTIIFFIVGIGILVFGCFHGFINYPKTERNTRRRFNSSRFGGYIL